MFSNYEINTVSASSQGYISISAIIKYMLTPELSQIVNFAETVL